MLRDKLFKLLFRREYKYMLALEESLSAANDMLDILQDCSKKLNKKRREKK